MSKKNKKAGKKSKKSGKLKKIKKAIIELKLFEKKLKAKEKKIDKKLNRSKGKDAIKDSINGKASLKKKEKSKAKPVKKKEKSLANHSAEKPIKTESSEQKDRAFLDEIVRESMPVSVDFNSKDAIIYLRKLPSIGEVQMFIKSDDRSTVKQAGQSRINALTKAIKN